MTYSQWIKQKTKLDTDDRTNSNEGNQSPPRFRYPIGNTIFVDNREMFDRFSSVRA